MRGDVISDSASDGTMIGATMVTRSSSRTALGSLDGRAVFAGG
jgi:hypothetical protein